MTNDNKSVEIKQVDNRFHYHNSSQNLKHAKNTKSKNLWVVKTLSLLHMKSNESGMQMLNTLQVEVLWEVRWKKRSGGPLGV